MINRENILKCLEEVIDPEIGLNIVELGLVYNIDITDSEISITMTLTTPGCPLHETITDWAKKSLTKEFPNFQISINLVWEPQWSPEKMTDEARQKLGV